MTTTTTTIEQEFLSIDAIDQLADSGFSVFLDFLNGIEIELETILKNEFKQGLLNDLPGGV